MSRVYNFKTFFLNILKKYLKFQNMALMKVNPINQKLTICMSYGFIHLRIKWNNIKLK